MPRRSRRPSRTCRSKPRSAGFAFATVRPRATRDPQTRTVNLVFAVDEGQRTYVERINVRGNTRTRDYAIRREFDLAEGDAYNRALVNRAERRLKNFSYFKSVKISTEPGSAPDESFSMSTSKNSRPAIHRLGRLFDCGRIPRRGQRCGAQSARPRPLWQDRCSYGQYTQGCDLSFVDPYFLGYRVALGLDLFSSSRIPRAMSPTVRKPSASGLNSDSRSAKI